MIITETNSVIVLNEQSALNLTALIETRLVVQANSGGGKTWALRRLLEQSHGRVQHIVIDVEGSLRTLREKYEYLLLGSETDQVDFPISPTNAGQIATLLLESRTSVIMDLYEFLPSVRQQIVRRFLDALINAPKALWHDCFVVIDEAHIFCPERGSSEAKPAIEALCSRGRARGFCAILATQRISKLGKDALGECNNKLIGRASLDIDMKRSNAELEFPAQSQALKKLTPGEFYAFGPAITPEVQKITIGPVRTTHPKAGSRRQLSSLPAPTSLNAVLEALKVLSFSDEQREQTEPSEGQYKGKSTGEQRQAPGTGPSLQDAQFAQVLAEKDAEIRRLRELVEALSRITITLDGKTLPVTALPSELHLDTLQIEQATIEVKQAFSAPSEEAERAVSAPLSQHKQETGASVVHREDEQRRYTVFKQGLKRLVSDPHRASLAYAILSALSQTDKYEMARADLLLALKEKEQQFRAAKVEALLINKRLVVVSHRGRGPSIYYRSLLQERLGGILPGRSAAELRQLVRQLFQE
ncbi:MAG TPA: zonular occludens toxin domain-containing protein [Ktedonobacteraceae bacterium]|nr:zonular occludens toxin domain-containing protein [Ktedonobacteraceae bacterium]